MTTSPAPTVSPPSPPPIADELERQRLEHRAFRLGLAVTLLSWRAETRLERDGRVPRILRREIDTFRAELAAIESRLGEPQRRRVPRLVA